MPRSISWFRTFQSLLSMSEYQYEIFADYFQINLEDEQFAIDTIDWNEEAIENMFAVGDRMMTMGTARNMDVPVTVEVRDDAPEEGLSSWDHVVEGSMEISSGCLIIRGCTDLPETSPHISLTAGWYRLRIYYGGLDKLSDDRLDGDDCYKIVLWPAAYAEPQILKRRMKTTLDSQLIQ